MPYLSIISLQEGYGCWADHMILHFLGVRTASESKDSPHLPTLTPSETPLTWTASRIRSTNTFLSCRSPTGSLNLLGLASTIRRPPVKSQGQCQSQPSPLPQSPQPFPGVQPPSSSCHRNGLSQAGLQPPGISMVSSKSSRSHSMLRRPFRSSLVVQSNSSRPTAAPSCRSSHQRWYSPRAVFTAFCTSLQAGAQRVRLGAGELPAAAPPNEWVKGTPPTSLYVSLPLGHQVILTRAPRRSSPNHLVRCSG